LNSSQRCFVICPVGEIGSSVRRQSDQLLQYVIEPAIAELGFSAPLRADQLPIPGVVTNQIVELLRDADLVIADLSGGNPNVFYELAVRLAFQRPVVHMVAEGDHIPFDVIGARAIFYYLQDLDKVSASVRELRAQVESTLAAGTNQDNPLVAALDAVVRFFARAPIRSPIHLRLFLQNWLHYAKSIASSLITSAP